MRPRVVVAGVVALVVAAIIAFAAKHVVLSENVHVPSQRPYDVLTVKWRRSDLLRASQPGRLCVDAGSRGRICARFGAWERPADALTAVLEQHGVRVRSR